MASVQMCLELVGYEEKLQKKAEKRGDPKTERQRAERARPHPFAAHTLTACMLPCRGQWAYLHCSCRPGCCMRR